ncbi:MAG: DUF1338 domain-containing protein [Bacteroidales bacterium]
MEYRELFKKLWSGYSEMNPSAHTIHHLLEEMGENIVNDHIAFRTYDIPGIDIESLSKVFREAGYAERGSYTFEKKKLRAKHYEHTEDNLAPKVFISELITSEFSSLVGETARMVAESTLKRISDSSELVFALNPWAPPSYDVYTRLLEESEYAAWVYVYGFRANHFTIFINYLDKFRDIHSLNAYLKESGFVLNNSGGEIKGTSEELLMQSSTLADMVEVDFIEGKYSIPGCYYEFAQRFEDVNGKLYSGFIAKSADKIFESTDSR